MTDKRYSHDGDYISKKAVADLNERHGWFQYGDAQSDVSNAFANDSIHKFLDMAKEAQEIHEETGMSPSQLSSALSKAVARIKDLMMEDDGYAHKEARKFLESIGE